MELDEVVRRILRRHVWLIAVAVLIGVGGVTWSHSDNRPEYLARARLVLDSPDPSTQTQSAVLADTARAIASGRGLVAAALRSIDAPPRDPAVVAERKIDVRPLGSSGVLELTVTDTQRRVAVDLANAVAAAVIDARQSVSDGDTARTARTLSREVAAVDQRLLDVEAHLAVLPVDGTADQRLLRSLEQTRATLSRRLDRLQGQLDAIRAEQASRPEAAVLDPAVAALPAPDGLVPDLVLGGLLGLVLGIGAAAAREVLAPTLGGAPALRRATGSPVLAELPRPPDLCGPADLAEAAEHVELAARAAGVGRVEVMSLVPDLDLTGFVSALDVALDTNGARLAPEHATDGRRNRSPWSDRRNVVALTGDRSRAGLVLVTPDQARLADLEPVRNLLTITAWPLLGVVVYRSPRSRLLRMWRGPEQGVVGESAAADGR